MTRHADLYFWEGEKPPPTTVRYEDADGNLITSIAGATFSAKTSIDGAAEVAVTCTDGGDGTLTIDWPTGTSTFVLAGTKDGTIRILVEVTQGANVWFLPMFAVPVKKRT
jgi:hypothetical protein